MNHLYQTKAYVLKSFPYAEHNKIAILLTQDLGVIRVILQAVRKIESKQRQSLQDFSSVNVALVHGRTGWRLTNAVINKNLHYDLTKEKFEVMARLFGLVERLVPDEEHDYPIFDIISEAQNFLESDSMNSPTKDELESLEIISALKILHNLGYVADHKEFSDEIAKKVSSGSLSKIQQHKKMAIQTINKAIKESQL